MKRYLTLLIILAVMLSGCGSKKVQAERKKPEVEELVHVVNLEQQAGKRAILETVTVPSTFNGYAIWYARLGKDGCHLWVRSAIAGLAPGDEVFLKQASDGGLYTDDIWRKKKPE